MAASSSTVAQSNNKWFHVFINHRGVDVKQTFAKSLYNRLRSIGLRAFLDEDELQVGYEFPSQIEQAIGTASVHVAILSPRYAESYWCLNELSLMLESHRANKVPIVPIFYGVTPSTVRWTQGKDGIYAEALKRLAEARTHEGKLRYDAHTIQNWSNALSQVADITGFDFNLKASKLGKELEMELLDKVVACLSGMLEKPDLPVPDYTTALNYKLKDLEEKILWPQQQSGKPQIMGICGLGGVGKTTLAKHFFNRKKSDYHNSCFLFQVRDSVSKSSLESLQRRLLTSLTGSNDHAVNSVDEGKMMLKRALQSSKALVILDDVTDVNHLQALLPIESHDLCSESIILITSRDKNVLIVSKLVEISSIYKLTSLSKQHARELFCFHAFKEANPPAEFKKLIKKFLKACHGFPLNLTVLATDLYGKDKIYWEDQLGRFPKEIKDSLKISYDALSREEQEIFLDIACFFIGENRDSAISIWNGSGWRGRRGLQNLQDKFLVEVDSRNMIRMHDHLKDLGKDIAASSSRRRIWSWKENAIEHLFSQSSNEQVINVRGMKMDLNDHHDYHDVLDRITAKRLHIVDTEGMVLERIWRRVELPKILWLRWINCPYSSLTSCIPKEELKSLRFLQVSGSVLNTLWETESDSQTPSQLPEFMEVLNTNSCVMLESIPGFAHCTKLRQLNVSGCSVLNELPSMETLVSLEEFDASGCVKLKSIRGFEHCTKLRQLNVSGCSMLNGFSSMETLVSLEEFNASGCVKLKSIRGLEQSAKLRILKVRGCSELEVLPNMKKLVSLKKLDIYRCVKLKIIDGLVQWAKLRVLTVSRCSVLEELPSMETLVSVEEFYAKGCVKLKSINSLPHCTKLRRLSISECSALEILPSMETLVSLEKFYAIGCVKLKSLRGLEQWANIRILTVNGCSQLEEMPRMEKLVSLEEFSAYGCVKLKSIQGLMEWANLRILNVSECSELKALPSMEKMASLEEFHASGCLKLKSIRGLEHCTKLRILYINRWCELKALPSMKPLVSLEELYAQECVKLKSMRGLGYCTKLRRLSVSGCSKLEALEGVEPGNMELDISDCPKLGGVGRGFIESWARYSVVAVIIIIIYLKRHN